MANWTIEVHGADKAAKALAQIEGGFEAAMEAALFEWAERVVGDAKELAPVDTGTLRNSGFVLTSGGLEVLGPEAAPSGEARALAKATDGPSAVMGFGGPSAPYALVQHERFPVKRVPGKQWKYLETPVKALANLFPKVLQKHTARLLKRAARGTA